MKNKTFQEIFYNARLDSETTFREISAACGLSIKELTDIQRGDKLPPDLDTIRSIEEVLKIEDGSLVSAATEEFSILKGKILTPHKFKLLVTEKQLNLIQAFVDLGSRLLSGQIEHPLWNLFISREIDHYEFQDACRKLKEIVFPQLHPHAYISVGWREDANSQNNSQIAYEIEAMIRHELWKRSPDAPKFVTCASEPLHYSREEFIKLEDVE